MISLALLIAAVLGMGYAIYQIGRIHGQEAQDQLQRIARLEEELSEIKQATNSGRCRSRGDSAALMDAIAVAIDLIQEEQANAAYRQTRIDQLNQILRQAQPGPHSYDPDRPAGGKPSRPSVG